MTPPEQPSPFFVPPPPPLDPSAPTFEEAPSPANDSQTSVNGSQTSANGSQTSGNDSRTSVNGSQTEDFSRRAARWRWAVSLLLVGLYPVWVSLLGRLRPQHGGKSGAALPSSVGGLLWISALELGTFALFWGLAWAFSRASKDELLLRWRGGVLPVLQGFGYAFALRMGLLFLIMFAAGAFLLLTHTDPKQFAHFIEQNQPQTDALFPPGALHNPLYLFLVVTLLSFVVAGVREELWRTACLAALRHVLPQELKPTARWMVAIAISSVVFGLGHAYQGWLGVVFTTILGAGLGAVTWQHRSIWPAVWAHGFIDATSFLAAAAMQGHKLPHAAWWSG